MQLTKIFYTTLLIFLSVALICLNAAILSLDNNISIMHR